MKWILGVLCLFSETGSEGGSWAIQDEQFIVGDQWAYEGVHILKSGDRLTVYGDAPGEILWEGTVTLRSYPSSRKTQMAIGYMPTLKASNAKSTLGSFWTIGVG